MRKLCCIILFLLLTGAQAQADMAYPVIAQGEELLFTADGRYVWVIDQGEITCYPEQDVPKPLGHKEHVAHLAGHGETLYLLSEEDGVQVLATLGMDGQETMLGLLPEGFYVHQMAAGKGTVYLLGQPEQPSAGSIPRNMAVYAVPLSEAMSGTMSPELLPAQEWKNSRINSIDVRDGILYVGRLMSCIAVDLEDGSAIMEHQLYTSPLAIAGTGVRDSGVDLRFQEDRPLCRVYMGTSWRDVELLEDAGYLVFQASDRGLYGLDHRDGTLYRLAWYTDTPGS